MPIVNIDDGLYETIRDVIKDDKVVYPSIKNFVDKAIMELIKKVREDG